MDSIYTIAGFILEALIFIGAIVGVYVTMDRRLTVVETKMESKIDKSELLQKLDDVKKELGEKLDKIAEKFDASIQRLWDAQKK